MQLPLHFEMSESVINHKSIAINIFGFIITLFDFGSDIWVGIHLFLACHYYFAGISFFLTSLPSIVVLLYASIGQFPIENKSKN